MEGLGWACRQITWTRLGVVAHGPSHNQHRGTRQFTHQELWEVREYGTEP